MHDRSSWRVSLVYAACGALWILFSDRAAELLFPDHAAYALAQTWKGWFFIAFTTLLLHLLIRREWTRLAAQKTELDALRGALVANEKLYRQLFEDNPLAMWIYDIASMRVLAVNEAAIRRYGYSREEWSLLTISELRPATDVAALEDMLRRRVGAAHYSGVAHHVRKDGVVMDVEVVSHPLEFLGRRARAVIVNDVTERTQSAAQIRHLTSYDPLTGLANRSLLSERLLVALAGASAEGHRCALLFLDLDRFKDINDSLGHAVGDLLLQETARRLETVLRAEDTVARLGADQFILLLRHVGEAAEVGTVATKVLAAIAQPVPTGTSTLHVTACIGLAVFPEDGEDEATLMRNADSALHHAMGMGRHVYQYYRPAMNVATRERFSLENDLRRALERGELELHYQAQVVLAGGLRGVEALARWPHAERGLIPPGRFIPVAEASGLIIPLGDWVLRTACAQAARWRAEGLPPLVMAVNLSALQFCQPGLVERVAEVLAETGLPAHCLELEVTESVIMDDAVDAMRTLAALREQGIRIAIDDFGTGYSSLAYLRRLAVSELKIDQSFVRAIHEDADAAAIVSTIINLAKSLRLSVIAEGVETAEQATWLHRQGCDEAQGYYFARPMPAADTAALIRAGLPTFPL
jgi:diguanylate cyclase (GGDEF)-like protein/PAS domain S-box-containing protein